MAILTGPERLTLVRAVRVLGERATLTLIGCDADELARGIAGLDLDDLAIARLRRHIADLDLDLATAGAL